MTDDKEKSKSFKNLEDLLKIEDSTPFDETQVQNEAKKLEERKLLLKEINDKRIQLESATDIDDYMGGMLKELVSMGMKMLTSLQLEIEAAPRGRDVETAASMMSAINGVIDNINKIKTYNAKMDLERQKMALKQQAVAAGNLPGGTTNNQNIIMFGSNNDIQDFLIEKGILSGNSGSKIKDATVLKANDDIVDGDK